VRVGDDELNALHAAAFGHDVVAIPWNVRMRGNCLVWVTARREDALVRFLDVIGDGAAHGALLDTECTRTRKAWEYGADLSLPQGKELLSRTSLGGLLRKALWPEAHCRGTARPDPRDIESTSCMPRRQSALRVRRFGCCASISRGG
jgi:hypothetical protein